MSKSSLLVGGVLLAGLAAFFLWPEGSGTGPGPSPDGPPTPIDPATAGTVSGVLRYEGPDPAPSFEDFEAMRSKGECSGLHHERLPDDRLLVKGGLVRNAVVFVSSGAEALRFAVPPEPVVMDQVGCRFLPRVIAVQLNQTVRFLNSDPTKHNVKGTPSGNGRGFNLLLSRKGSVVEHRIEAPELAMRLDCSYHGWMRGWIAAFPHPFFAVTGEDGAFTLKGLPPGEYGIEAWHEILGRAGPLKVRVEASGTARADLSFPAKP